MKSNEFLRNIKNKEKLINIIVKFIKSNKSRQLINSPFIVTAGEFLLLLIEKTEWKLTGG